MTLATVTMPQLGESVTEGTVDRWLKSVGDFVQRDEPLMEVVTDKVNTAIPSPFEGRLARILIADGETVPVGSALAEIEVEAGAKQQRTEPVLPNPRTSATTDAAAAPAMTPSRQQLSPAVKRLAAEHGLDLSLIAGSGHGGRVSRADVLAHIEASSDAAARESRAVDDEGESVGGGSILLGPGEELVRLSAARRQIANHMVKSVSTIPHVWGMREVDMTALVRYREENKERFQQRHGIPLSYLPFVIQAVCDALKENPFLNSRWSDEGIVLNHNINIGVAVALPDALIVPVIKNADQMGLSDLNYALHNLATRARNRQLRPDDVQGGTFTVNNTGANGAFLSMSIINHPQAAILNTEAIVRRPVGRDDTIVLRDIMNVTMSFDHRILDGLKAGRFLEAVKRGLEDWTPSAIKI